MEVFGITFSELIDSDGDAEFGDGSSQKKEKSLIDLNKEYRPNSFLSWMKKKWCLLKLFFQKMKDNGVWINIGITFCIIISLPLWSPVLIILVICVGIFRLAIKIFKCKGIRLRFFDICPDCNISLHFESTDSRLCPKCKKSYIVESF